MLDAYEYGLMLQFPCVVKARTDGAGRWLVEVEASNEEVDEQGDVICQAALLESAAEFLAHGHADLEHLSEIGDRLGIKNPTDYIVGVPTEVSDLGAGRTGVTIRLNDSAKANELWRSLTTTPPVRWLASIYGFPIPGELIDARTARAGTNLMGATRFLVRGLRWVSLAFTRRPINTAIAGAAHVVSAKAFIAIAKARLPYVLTPTKRVKQMSAISTKPRYRVRAVSRKAEERRDDDRALRDEIVIDAPDGNDIWDDADRMPSSRELDIGPAQSASGSGARKMVSDYSDAGGVTQSALVEEYGKLAEELCETRKELAQVRKAQRAMAGLLTQMCKADENDEDAEEDADETSDEDEREEGDLEKGRIPTLTISQMMAQLSGQVKKSRRELRRADRRVNVPPSFAISKAADELEMRDDLTFEQRADIASFRQRVAAYRAGKLPYGMIYNGLHSLPPEYCNARL